MAEKEKETAKPAAEKAPENKEVKGVEKLADEMANGVVKILSPVLMIALTTIVTIAAITGLFSTKAGMAMWGVVGRFLRFSGLLGLAGAKAIYDNWGDICEASKDVVKKLMLIAGILAAVVLVFSIAAGIAIWADYYCTAAVIIMLMALPFYITGDVLHGIFKRWAWSMDIHRTFACVAVIVYFVACCVLAMPTVMSTKETVIGLIAVLGLGCSWLLLLGRRSNRLYHWLFTVGTTLVVISIVTSVLPAPVKNFSKETSQTVLGLFGHGAKVTRVANMKPYKTLEDAEGFEAVDKDGKPVFLDEEKKTKFVLSAGEEVLVDEAMAIPIGDYPFYYYFVTKIAKGKVMGQGYVPSDLLEAVKPPEPPKQVPQDKEVKKPESKPAAASLPPAAPPVEPAVDRPNETEAVIGPEWTDTGIILKKGEFCQWYQLRPEQGDSAYSACDRGLLDTMVFRFKLPGEVLTDLGGISVKINGTVGGYYGMCHITDDNKNNTHLFVRNNADSTVGMKFLLIQPGE